MASALEKVLAAQTDYRERFDAYLAGVDSVDLSAFPREVEVSMRASDAGWVAVARLERFMSGCVVYDGAIQPPHAAVQPREPKYLPIEDLPENLSRVVETRRPE